ncbi:MAG: hypothetical protein OEW60_05590 [Thiovulaceae bacterium]|nr:hypothetical protein [Sulfurimonadaceae bacterium]
MLESESIRATTKKLAKWILLLLITSSGILIYLFLFPKEKVAPMLEKTIPQKISKTVEIKEEKASKSQILDAPKELMATDGDSEKITLIWSQVPDAQGYDIYRSSNHSSFKKIASNISKDLYIDRDIRMNENYTYKVKAFNLQSQSPFSQSDLGFARLPEIKSLQASLGSFDDRIKLRWEEGFDSYDLYRATTAKGNYQLIQKAYKKTTFVDRQISPCGHYYYKVRGFKKGKANLLSAWKSGFPSCEIKLFTYAGSSTQGQDDARNLNQATFDRPIGIVWNKEKLYIADSDNHAVRLIDQNGVLSTIAQHNSKVKKRVSSFYKPTNIAVDSQGNIFVTEVENHLIRKISSNGKISIFAGNGKIGDKDGVGINARFNKPYGIYIDKDDTIYITELGNHKIKKITAKGKVTTFIGNGQKGRRDGSRLYARFDHPTAIVKDSKGRFFISDSNNNNIRIVDQQGDVKTFAGSGQKGAIDAQGVMASFNDPRALVCDKYDNLYVADTGNHALRMILPNAMVKSFVSVFETKNKTGDIRFFSPRGLAINTRLELFITDFHAHKIMKVDLSNSSKLAKHVIIDYNK